MLNIIKDSLNDKMKLNKKSEGQQELYSSRYMLIIDESEDESAMRLLFVYGILDHSAKIHMCSEFMEESDLNVSFLLVVYWNEYMMYSALNFLNLYYSNEGTKVQTLTASTTIREGGSHSLYRDDTGFFGFWPFSGV